LLDFFDLPFGVQRCLYVADINQNASDKSGNNWKMVLQWKEAESMTKVTFGRFF